VWSERQGLLLGRQGLHDLQPPPSARISDTDACIWRVNICTSAVLIAIGAGDHRALEKLYLNYRKRLVRFLLRFTQSDQDIEEIINDTLMVVWCALTISASNRKYRTGRHPQYIVVSNQ
jgi:hypothetical protein